MIEQIIETMQSVLIDGKVKAAIEIKMNSAPQISKGFRITMADTNAQAGFVIAKTNETYKIEENITVTSLSSFLTEFLPKL